MKIFTTADDFGLTDSANGAIVSGLKKGEIHYVSLMTNMPATRKAIELYKSNKFKNIGLHFNLVEGKPLSSKEEVKTLVTGKGEFYPLPLFLARLLLGMVDREHIRIELIAQLGFMRENGLEISHLNSHQNVHIFSPVWNVVLEQAEVRGIGLVRKKSSVVRRLKRFPVKLFVFQIADYLLSRRYPAKKTAPQAFEENLIHPGTTYDYKAF